MKPANIFIVYKPKGHTSYNIIAQIKHATGEQRVGHAGTLDPLAEGVLVVGLGREATKNLSEVVKKEKEYIADIKLGVVSSTDDEEGLKHKNTKTQKHKVHQGIHKINGEAREGSLGYKITKKDIEEKLNIFIGTIDQIPPVYSAIKIGGQRSYKLARAGQSVELKSRSVEIKSIKIIKYKFPNLKIKVVCGPGVYIRSLARDIGTSLSTGAYMSGLKRTRVGQFKINKAIAVSGIAKIYLAQQVKLLKQGGIGVIPTDTIYGLVGQALKEKTVSRIYKIRKRSPDKPFIILISSTSDLKKFGVKINLKTQKILKQYWPGAVSVILACDKKLTYLHRGTNFLAFRLPANTWLINLLKKTGPLVAPSANLEGQNPALTIKQAKRYFNNLVDFYIDRGKIESEPSTLIKLESNKIIILRAGSVKIN